MSQKLDIEEPYIYQTSDEDQKAKGAFNAIYNMVINQSNDSSQLATNGDKTESSILTEEPYLGKEQRSSLSNLLFSRNEAEDMKNVYKSKENMYKSREIHRQLLNKNRWKPSELELAVLKLHFEKNKYPSKEEKEALLKNLVENFKSSIEISQLNRWFQHEREKGARHGFRGISKNTYKKFGKEELDFLKEKFDINTYPKTEEMVEMSKSLGVSLSKIENWYKHNRRSLAKKGAFTLKTKKYFKKDEVNYLLKMFEMHPRPTKEQIFEMSEHLSCNELQIKNWYSNKRKKQKLMAKKQCSENQEAQLHQNSIPAYSQMLSQPSEMIINNNPQIITMNNFPQATDASQGYPNFVQNSRPVNTFQVSQAPSPYQPQVFPNIQYMPVAPNMNMGNYQTVPMNALNMGGFGNGTVPVLIVPASSIGPGGQIQLGPNVGTIGQEQDMKNFVQPQAQVQQQPFLFKANETASQQQVSNSPSIMSYNMQQQQQQQAQNTFGGFGTFKQNGMSADKTSGWANPAQPMQSSNPVIIVSSNKAPTIQNQQMAFNIQNAPNNMVQGNFNGGNFIQAGNGTNGPTYISYEPPMQIQYLTSLYCPYSNNNIFSSCYPMMVQNNSGYPGQNTGKPMGMENMMGNGAPVITQQMPNNTLQFSNGGVFRNPEISQNPNLVRNANEANKF